MNERMKEAFGQVRAEEALKDSTMAFLAERTRGYTRAKAGKRPLYAYAAACACLLLTLLGGRWLYFTPTAEISVDINPSIELCINRFDRVIAVNAFNRDGQELSNALNVRFKSYTAAIEQILNDGQISSLLSGDEILTFTVTGPDDTQSSRIFSNVEAYTAEHGNAYCYFASPEEVASAHACGLSHGKYRAFLEIQSLDPDITPEDIQDMTMREIRDLIDCHSTGCEDASLPHNGWDGGPHGHGSGHGPWHGNGKRGMAEN